MKKSIVKVFSIIFILSAFLFAQNVPDGVQKLQNTDFETDSLDSWYLYSLADSLASVDLNTDSVITGKNCAHINVYKTFKNYPSGRIMFNTPVKIYNNTKYYLTFKIRANKAISGNGIWWAFYDNRDDHTSYYDGMWGQLTFDADTTITYETEFVTSFEDTLAYFSIDLAAIPTDSVEIWLDDVELVIEAITPGVVPDGSGSADDPYQISSLGNLSWLTQSPSGWWNKHYVQINDIDGSATMYWDLSDDNEDGDRFNDANDLTEEGDNDGWKPIGGEFNACRYNGGGYVIDGLTVNGGSDKGLFSTIKDCYIENLGIINIDFTGDEYMGGLAGTFYGDSVINCYATGKITATGNRIGGLLGYLSGSTVSDYVADCYSDVKIETEGKYCGGFIGNIKGVLTATIERCYSAGDIDGAASIGGFIGKGENKYDSTIVIIECYSAGDVVGGDYSGGFIGYNKNAKAVVSNSYSLGDVTQIAGGAMDDLLGGFCGYNNAGLIENSYSIGSVMYADTVISGVGFVAKNKGDIISCFFDTSLSNQDSSLVAEGKTTAEMMTDTTFINAGWDMTNVWKVDRNYPDLLNNHNSVLSPIITIDMEKPEGSGTESDPFKIASIANLSWLTQTDSVQNSYYIQTQDIDASATVYWDDSDDNGDGDKYNDFNDGLALGNNDGWLPIKSFSGSYDGDGFKISGVSIVNRKSFMGFGFILNLSDASIRNLTLDNVNMKGNNIGGVLAAKSEGCEISNTYTSGSLTQVGSGEKVAGFVSWIVSGLNKITDCSSDVTIIADSSTRYVAGFVSYIDDADSSSVIKRCYSESEVENGQYTIGGFVAKNQAPKLQIAECYSTGSVAGFDRVGGFVGYNKTDCIILNCYNLGDVNYLAADDGEIKEFGSFCGYNKGSIEKSYTVGVIETPNMVDTVITTHGFVGREKGNTSACFFDSTVSNQKSDVGAAAKTTLEMMTVSTYTDSSWDFVNVWEIVDTNYPTFKEIVDAIGDDQLTEVVPSAYELKQNYPNPFNPTTTIGFALPQKSLVKISIYNILGQKVVDILNAKMNAGFHEIKYDASRLSSGVYIYRITAGNFVSVKKMMLLK
jgi:hypothetical protein